MSALQCVVQCSAAGDHLILWGAPSHTSPPRKLQTVPVSQVTEMARPPPRQTADELQLTHNTPQFTHSQTVPVSQVLETARPLPKQTIDKPTVWVAFIGGAIAVFGVTVLAENNEKFFPAISRANAAIAMSRKRAEVRGRAAALP